jgi:hypothetical protein
MKARLLSSQRRNASGFAGQAVIPLKEEFGAGAGTHDAEARACRLTERLAPAMNR